MWCYSIFVGAVIGRPYRVVYGASMSRKTVDNVAISVIAGTINVTVSDCINSVIKKIISVRHKTLSSN